MTTLLIKPWVLENDKAKLRECLEARGGEIKRFDFVHWVKNWLKDPAGSFWGRKVIVPKVGDVCLARVKTCSQEGDAYVATGHIADTQCKVRGKTPFDQNVKVRVLSVGEKGAECEVADEMASLSRKMDVRYKIYYSAAGVTGTLERSAWRSDVVSLIGVFPNELLPTSLISGFERIPLPTGVESTFDVYSEGGKNDDSGYVLAVECENCRGQQKLTCSRCGGSGRYQPECNKCGGSGRYQPVCNACGGSGYSTCRKCGGSGIHESGGTCYSCNGSGQHECGVCRGDGSVDLECGFCHGEGHLDFDCKACGGTGEQECWVCHGTGVRRVRADYKTGELSISGKDKERVCVSSEDVFLWRERDDDHVEITAGAWDAIERAVRSAIDQRASATARAQKLRQFFEGVLRKLDEKILHQDTTQLPPIHAVLNSASLNRKRGRVIYLLREKGAAAWKKVHNEPYPKGTTLKIDGFEMPPDLTICYEGYRPSSRELEVSFPQQVDVSGLRDRDLEIRSAEMRPPELRQKEYLQRWIDDFGSPIHQAIIRGCEATSVKGLKLFNDRISKYERQREAVEYGSSKAPLFLLKGPPGTGKTTIIVEIIRQAAHKGQRVLLTSQTHQAVENVLEKLHGLIESGEDKFIRMVHYTAQEGKSSELARRYSDGSGTAEIKTMREYVAGRLAKNDRLISAVYSPLAKDALKKLCDEGVACAERIERAQDARKTDLEEFDRELAASMAKIDEETASLLEVLDSSIGDEIRRNQENLERIERAIAKADEAVLKSKTIVSEKQKRVRSLSGNTVRSKILGALSVFSDNFDIEAVRSQLVEAREKYREAMCRRGTLSNEIGGIRKTIGERQSVYNQGKNAIEGAASNRRTENSAAAERRRIQKVAEHNQAIDSACGSYLQQIEDLNRFLGNDAGLSAASAASDWQEVYRRAEDEGMRLKHEQEFLSEWEKTLTDKPESVGKFLKSQTNVFLATCVGVGGWRSLMDGTYDRRFEDIDGIKPERFFDLVIVDEAGHATSAETIIPLSMGRRAILIGDDKQLPPIDDEDLETESLFSKLWEDENCHVPRIMLDTQFRMHPDIADFVSATFYNGELKNGVTESERAFQFSAFNRPVCLLSTSNQPNHFETWKKPSFENQLEAKYVKEILDALITHCKEHGVKGETVSVAVITPYAEQVSLIRQLLRPLIGASGNVQLSEDDIASVDKFQGGERDIVIASFVRSPKPNVYAPKLSFVQDLKRMNVAFSRPRKMLILVGDIKALSTELGDEDGRKAFEAFHGEVRKKGLEVLAWERKTSR